MKLEPVLWILASPMLALEWLFRLVVRGRFWRAAYTPHLICSYCRAQISLVGLWKCNCAYTYRGHLMRVCPVCGSLPSMIRCYRCGVTQKLPEP